MYLLPVHLLPSIGVKVFNFVFGFKMSQRGSGSSRSSHASENNGDSTLRTENDITGNFENTTDIESSTLLTSSALSSTQVDSEAENKITKHEIERKQLLHDLELVRIELSQKNLVIDNMKVDHMSKVDELEELLADTRHEKQILQARLESQLKLQQEEAKSSLERTRQEMAKIFKRQQLLEIENKKLQEKAVDYRKGLIDLDLSDEQYLELKSTDSEELNLREFVMVSLLILFEGAVHSDLNKILDVPSHYFVCTVCTCSYSTTLK